MPRRLAVLACAAWISFSSSLRSQNNPSESSSIFADQIDVRVVNVEVVVTDRQGNRVTGLKPGDFRLLVDRKPVAVEYFTEVREGEAIAASGAPDALDSLPSLETGGPVGTNYLVFIDDLFPIASHRNAVLAGLEKEVSSLLGPQDRMAIIAWDGSRLVRLADWSRSGPDLAAALRRAAGRPTHGLTQRLELRRLIDNKKLDEGGGPVEIADQLSRMLELPLSMAEIAYGLTVGRQIESTVSAVVSAMRASSAPAGRKVMLLLCGGWPFSLEGALRGNGPRPLSRDLPENEPMLRSLTSAANLLGFTVYPVDVPGVTTMAGDLTAQPGLLTNPSSSFGPGGRQFGGTFIEGPIEAGYGSAREQEVEGTLHFIAKETGGKPMLNSNRMLALSRAGVDTRTYYWLGFTPAWRRDDKTHRVEVKVRRGLRARSRTNFADLSQAAEVNMKMESALLFGDLPEGVRMAVHLGVPASSRQRGVTEIPLALEVPVSAVTLLPVDGKYAGKVELRLAATDERGAQSQIPVIPVELSSPVPPAEGQTVRYETKIFLRGQARRVVAVIYDPLSGKLAAGAGELAVR